MYSTGNRRRGEDLKNRISYYVERLMRKGVTVTQIIDLCGIGRTSFYDIMNGKQVPKLNTAYKIADALKVDIKELFPDLKTEN